MEPIVTIEHLNHFSGQGLFRKQVLFDLDFKLYPGEIVLMTGASGSGKTMLLTLIGGLCAVQEGSIIVLGQQLRGASKQDLNAIRRHIGYICQDCTLLDSLTARQNVEIAMQLHPEIADQEAHDRTEKILSKLGLGDRMDDYPEHLSEEDKQLVAIARALVSYPQLILADEPTEILESQSEQDVVKIMQQLAKEQGCTILIVTCDNRLLEIADRIVRMENGCLTSADLSSVTL